MLRRQVKMPSQNAKSKCQVLNCELFYIPLKIVHILISPDLIIQQLYIDDKLLLHLLVMLVFGR